DRPQAILRMPPAEEAGPCPFCPGNEAMTPPELLVHREPNLRANGPGWTLRVIPNKFPALRTEISMSRRGVGPYDQMAGVGAHEVIIETPQHGRALHELSLAEVQSVLAAFQARLVDLARDERLRYVQIFKNEGAAA